MESVICVTAGDVCPQCNSRTHTFSISLSSKTKTKKAGEVFFSSSLVYFYILCSHFLFSHSLHSLNSLYFFFFFNSPILDFRERNKQRERMEKALIKVGSIKSAAGSFWITKKAKEELIDISQDITVCSFLSFFFLFLFFAHFLHFVDQLYSFIVNLSCIWVLILWDLWVIMEIKWSMEC